MAGGGRHNNANLPIAAASAWHLEPMLRVGRLVVRLEKEAETCLAKKICFEERGAGSTGLQQQGYA